jgi:hypothetical protein
MLSSLLKEWSLAVKAWGDEFEGCDVDQFKTEPDDLEEEELKKDMKALEDQGEGQRINAFDAVKVKTESEV